MSSPIGVIWDVDGTLVDTAELHFDAWVRLAGEIDKPERNIPRALIYGMLLVIAVYLITNVAYFYALPFSEVLTANSTAYRDALPTLSGVQQWESVFLEKPAHG